MVRTEGQAGGRQAGEEGRKEKNRGRQEEGREETTEGELFLPPTARLPVTAHFSSVFATDTAIWMKAIKKGGLLRHL
jgi:hypothetical protein